MSTIPPNLLVITAHDLGCHLGCQGVTGLSTPALDRLAGAGVRLDRCFAVAPTCSPSRAGLFTGRWPHCNGVMGLTHGNFAWRLHPGEQHLASICRAAGYATAGYGVTHEDNTVATQAYADCRPFTAHFRPTAGDLADLGAAFLTERAAAAQNQPWLLHVGTFEPHHPFDFGGVAPDDPTGVMVPDYLENLPAVRAELAHFQAAIRVLDRAVGRLLDALDRSGQADNTIVLFTTDHGIPFPRAKASLYDAGLRVATLLRWPAGGWTGGRASSALASNIDLLPTLLAAAGIPVPAAVQGRNLSAVLDGHDATGPNAAVFAEQTYHGGSLFFDPRRALRTASHKLIANFTTSAPWPADSDWMVSRQLQADLFHQTQHGATPYLECYDLVDDPGERRNLAADPAHASLVSNLAARLHAWMRDTGDPLLQGFPTPPCYHETLRRLAVAH